MKAQSILLNSKYEKSLKMLKEQPQFDAKNSLNIIEDQKLKKVNVKKLIQEYIFNPDDILSLHIKECYYLSNIMEIRFNFQNLLDLDLSGSGIEQLHPLPENIINLNLRNNRITDLIYSDSRQKISVFFGMRRLIKIDLSSNMIKYIGDEVAESIKSVIFLDLSKNDLKLNKLKPLNRLFNLTSLNLAFNQLESLISLKELQNNRRLAFLNLEFNPVVQRGCPDKLSTKNFRKDLTSIILPQTKYIVLVDTDKQYEDKKLENRFIFEFFIKKAMVDPHGYSNQFQQQEDPLLYQAIEQLFLPKQLEKNDGNGMMIKSLQLNKNLINNIKLSTQYSKKQEKPIKNNSSVFNESRQPTSTPKNKLKMSYNQDNVSTKKQQKVQQQEQPEQMNPLLKSQSSLNLNIIQEEEVQVSQFEARQPESEQAVQTDQNFQEKSIIQEATDRMSGTEISNFIKKLQKMPLVRASYPPDVKKSKPEHEFSIQEETKTIKQRIQNLDEEISDLKYEIEKSNLRNFFLQAKCDRQNEELRQEKQKFKELESKYFEEIQRSKKIQEQLTIMERNGEKQIIYLQNKVKVLINELQKYDPHKYSIKPSQNPLRQSQYGNVLGIQKQNLGQENSDPSSPKFGSSK